MSKRTNGKPDRVLRLQQVCDKTGLGHDSVYRLARVGDFPKRIKISSRASGWVESEIDAWIQRRTALRDAG